MALNLADQYYMKAFENYPYNLEEAMENLNYALSYDAEHVGANCLMGKLYFEQLADFIAAEEFFMNALAIDPCNLKVYAEYVGLLIQKRDFQQARKVIRFALKIEGVDMGLFTRQIGIIYELERQLVLAIEQFQLAKTYCFEDYKLETLNNDICRVEEKLNAQNEQKIYVQWTVTQS